MALICRLILETVQGVNPKRYFISIDEKTGIQALERIEQIAPVSKGGHTRREFEYKRNGTTTLMAALNIADGKIETQSLNPTRTEVDFYNFIKKVTESIVSKEPAAEIIFLTDQLNTHVSESLVKWVAEVNHVQTDLGLKGKEGILKNKRTRQSFLESEEHTIRFLYTPKHCSWLNPIENWFAKLQRHVVEKGNFKSVEELNCKIEKYIVFYNGYLHKAINWKFKGFIKTEILKNFKPSNN